MFSKVWPSAGSASSASREAYWQRIGSALAAQEAEHNSHLQNSENCSKFTLGYLSVTLGYLSVIHEFSESANRAKVRCVTEKGL